MAGRRRKWWVCCSKFAIQVNTDENGRITFAAPIAKKFMGQPLQNLLRWAEALGGFHYTEL